MNKGLQLALWSLAALAIAGCGGAGSSETSSTAITKAEFISQADAICQESNAAIEGKIESTFGGGAKPSKQEEIDFVTETILPGIKGDLTKIRELQVPQGDEEQVTQFLEDAEAGVAEANDDPEGFPQSAPSLNKASEEAAAYGLKVCGQDPDEA